jgi:hypothetical protein
LESVGPDFSIGMGRKLAAVYGAMWYRLMLDESLDDDFADRLAAFAVAGLHRPPARRPV